MSQIEKRDIAGAEAGAGALTAGRALDAAGFLGGGSGAAATGAVERRRLYMRASVPTARFATAAIAIVAWLPSAGRRR